MQCLDAAISESVRIFDIRPEITWGEIRFLQDITSNPVWPGEAKIEKINLCGMKSEMITSKALKQKPTTTVMYLHGGGFCLGGLTSYRKPICNFSKATGARFLLPEYGLAPESQFPTSLNNLFELYKYLLTRDDVDPKRIFIAGDSAGGGLAMSLMIMIRDHQIQSPVGLILISPWTDLTPESCVQSEKLWDSKRFGSFRKSNLATRFAKAYLGDHDPSNVLVSPTYGNFAEFPPIFMVAGGEELLLPDINLLFKKLEEQKVKVTYEVENFMPHVFPILHQDMDPRVDHTIFTIGNFIKSIVQ
jgi:acetyl esterase/lipase